MDNMDYDMAKFYWDVVITLLVGGNFLYTFITNKADKSQQHMQSTDQRIILLDKDVLQLQSQVNHLPNHQEVGEIHEKINAVGKDVSKIRGQLEGLEHSIQLLNEYLLRKER